MKKTPVLYKLTDQCRDEVQRCVDLLRLRDEAEGRYWGKRDRTEVIHRAVNVYVTLLEQERKEYEAKKEESAKLINSIQPNGSEEIHLSGGKVSKPGQRPGRHPRTTKAKAKTGSKPGRRK